MGSFDVSCGISNLAIHPGDKTGFMLISDSAVIKKHLGRQPVPEGGSVHYDSETVGYKPYLPSVFGVYNDYGNVTDIRPSATTEFLESLFHKPTEEVLDCVASDRHIYSPYGSIYQHYFIGDDTFTKHGASLKDALVALGFEYFLDSDGHDAYAFGGYEIHSTGTENRYNIPNPNGGKYLEENLYSRDITELLSVFGEVTAVYPGFDSAHYWAIRKLYRLSGTYFLEDVYTKMRDSNTVLSFRTSRADRLKEDWGKFIEFMNDHENSQECMFISDLDYKFDSVTFLNRDTSFDRERYDLLGHFTDANEFFQMRDYVNILDSVNQVLLPSHCGEQHGNDEASAYLAKITRKIAKQRIWEYR